MSNYLVIATMEIFQDKQCFECKFCLHINVASYCQIHSDLRTQTHNQDFYSLNSPRTSAPARIHSWEGKSVPYPKIDPEPCSVWDITQEVQEIAISWKERGSQYHSKPSVFVEWRVSEFGPPLNLRALISLGVSSLMIYLVPLQCPG